MNQFIIKSGKKLRRGYTTGTCAAGATKASAMMLFTREKVKNLHLMLPNGEDLCLEIHEITRVDDCMSCCIIKDAGDDPDVTNGIKVFSKVKKTSQGIIIGGGIGVGRVTKAGLSIGIGHAAINPGPLKMIEKELLAVAKLYSYTGGFEVEISVPGGEEIAQKTFNARMGIVGGISILGTTGIVDPMSETALIDTIKLEINSRKENGKKILFISPGNYGLEFSKNHLGLDIQQAVKCSNFIGEALDYAVYKGFKRILLVGHIGKLGKLAAGVMNTHSKISDGRQEIFAAHSALVGAKKEVIQKIMDSSTTDEIHEILEQEQISQQVYKSVLKKIVFHVGYRVMNKIQVELIIFSVAHGILMKTEQADEAIRLLKE